MEKRAIGVILTILGIVGLVMCAINFVDHGGGVRNVKMVITFGVLGLVFFTSGIGLIRSTKDVVSNNEHVS